MAHTCTTHCGPTNDFTQQCANQMDISCLRVA